MLNIIAEIGASHAKDYKAAQALCVAAMEGGADWVKLQTYTPDTISHKGAGLCPSGPWKGRPLYEIYEEAHMSREMQDELITWMKKAKIPWFSTPFSPEDVAWLEERECPMYKISSFDRDNTPLWAAILATDKRTIVSDGMGDVRAGVVLRCVSEYPANPVDYGLANRPVGEWGISDHTMSSMLGVVAIGKGATWIEKHIKLNGDEVTPDAGFAADCTSFARQCATWRAAYEIATSTKHAKSSLAGIVPQPVMVDGKKVWRRGNHVKGA